MRYLNSNRPVTLRSDPLFALRDPEPPPRFIEINELVLRSVPVGFNAMGGLNADEVNNVAAAGGFMPPYASGTVVMRLVAARDARFVRIYDQDEMHCGRVSPWLLNEDDVVGLTPRHVAGKFNLCAMPNMIADVVVPAGTRVCMGITPRIPHWTPWGTPAKIGGGIQFLLDTPPERIPERWFGPGKLLAKSRVISRSH